MTAGPTPPAERRIPAPAVNPEIEPYFAAADSGRLLIRHCLDCARPHHYPRSICPHCFSDRTEWREADGFGSIHTYSVLARGVPVPYCIAYVTLDEGVSMLTNIVDCDFAAVRIGARVRVVFKPTDGGPAVPMFTLA
jgi:uncharacterized OB-fold protein